MILIVVLRIKPDLPKASNSPVQGPINVLDPFARMEFSHLSIMDEMGERFSPDTHREIMRMESALNFDDIEDVRSALTSVDRNRNRYSVRVYGELVEFLTHQELWLSGPQGPVSNPNLEVGSRIAPPVEVIDLTNEIGTEQASAGPSFVPVIDLTGSGSSSYSVGSYPERRIPRGVSHGVVQYTDEL